MLGFSADVAASFLVDKGKRDKDVYSVRLVLAAWKKKLKKIDLSQTYDLLVTTV